MRERVGAAGFVAVGIAVATALVLMPAAIAALVIGVLAFSVAYGAPEMAGKILGMIAAGLMIGAPLIILALDPAVVQLDQGGPFGVLHLWAQIVRSDGLKLVTGHGFDTAVRALMSGLLPARSPRGILFEVWYELGVIGAAGTAALLWYAFVAAGRVSRIVAPFLLGALACVFTVSIAGVSIAQLWWTTLLAAAALAFAVVLRTQARSERVQVQVLKERPVVKI